MMRPFAGQIAGRHLRHAIGVELGLAQLRETEVEDLHPAIVGDHHVRGLQVAMGDALLVRRGDRVADPDPGSQQRIERHAARRDQRRQQPPFHQLHRQERDTVGLFDRVDGDDVGVIEGGDGPGFALEARAALGV